MRTRPDKMQYVTVLAAIVAVLLAWLKLANRRNNTQRSTNTSSIGSTLPKTLNSTAGSANVAGGVGAIAQSSASNMWTFDYTQYLTKTQDFKTWVDHIFDKLRLPNALTALLVALAVYLGGLVLALSINFQAEYISSFAPYMGGFGVGWVVWAVRYGSQRIHSAYAELRPCFLVSDQEYKRKLAYWFRILSSDVGSFTVSIVFLLVAFVAVYFSFYRMDVLEPLQIRSLRPFIFPPSWYTPDDFFIKSLIVAYFGFCVAFPLGTGFRLLLVNVFFLWNLRHFRVIPVANIVRVRLRKITDLYLFAAIAWFLGVSLFGIVFFDTLDILSIIALGGLSLIGLLTFLVPQLIFRTYLFRGYRLTCDMSLLALNKILRIDLREEPDQGIMDLASAPTNLADLAAIVEAVNRPSFWVYDPEDFGIILLSQALAFLSVFYQGFFQSLF